MNKFYILILDKDNNIKILDYLYFTSNFALYSNINNRNMIKIMIFENWSNVFLGWS